MYELIKIIFLKNATVRTNKMKFWRLIKRGQNMRELPKREEFLFILLVLSQIECLSSIFNKTNILNSMVKIENKQPNHLLCRFTYNVRYTRRYHPVNSFYDISDPVLDWSGMTIVLIGIVTKKVQLLFTTDG